jgi:hypothetical protein
LVEFGFAEFDAGGMQGIDELEELPLPADELGSCLPATTIVIGHVSEGFEVLGGWGDVAWLALATIRKDGALVEVAVAAAAGWFTTLAAQGVEGAGHEGLAAEAGFEQAGQELLKPAELGAEGTEVLLHGSRRGHL